MKIKSLEIYGYGQLMSRKIKFDQSFMQIYGENEAENQRYKHLFILYYLAFQLKRK